MDCASARLDDREQALVELLDAEDRAELGVISKGCSTSSSPGKHLVLRPDGALAGRAL